MEHYKSAVHMLCSSTLQEASSQSEKCQDPGLPLSNMYSGPSTQGSVGYNVSLAQWVQSHRVQVTGTLAQRHVGV